MTVGFLLFSSASALAQTEAPPAEEKMVCKRFVETGRITAKRVCLTKAQWAAIDDLRASRRLPLTSFTPIQLERGL
jgi:Spy/CpxP family protein refolding chaperone